MLKSFLSSLSHTDIYIKLETLLDTVFIVLQHTGLVLQAAKRIQGNIYIHPVANVR